MVSKTFVDGISNQSLHQTTNDNRRSSCLGTVYETKEEKMGINKKDKNGEPVSAISVGMAVARQLIWGEAASRKGADGDGGGARKWH